MRRTILFLVGLLVLGVAVLTWFANSAPQPGHVQDEAMLAGRAASSFPAAADDYFHDMDLGIQMGADKIKGRNMWIVDYNYSDEIDGYRKSPDSLAGRGGLRIRDEIRMIRPGFYLGRAYTNHAFLLNFTLYNAEVAERGGRAFARGESIAEDCWPGEQAQTAAR